MILPIYIGVNINMVHEIWDSHGDYYHAVVIVLGFGQIIRKAIETELQLNNINREDGFSLSTSWKPLIRDLR
jgi:hypothetical protein